MQKGMEGYSTHANSRYWGSLRRKQQPLNVRHFSFFLDWYLCDLWRVHIELRGEKMPDADRRHA